MAKKAKAKSKSTRTIKEQNTPIKEMLVLFGCLTLMVVVIITIGTFMKTIDTSNRVMEKTNVLQYGEDAYCIDTCRMETTSKYLSACIRECGNAFGDKPSPPQNTYITNLMCPSTMQVPGLVLSPEDFR